MRRVLFVVFLVVACATGAAADSYEDAVSALEFDDYALAMGLFRPLAEQGHARAQFNMGVLHEHGHAGYESYTEAVQWHRKAAEQGHAQAQYNLGLMYAQGQGAPQDYQEALKWYRCAMWGRCLT